MADIRKSNQLVGTVERNGVIRNRSGNAEGQVRGSNIYSRVDGGQLLGTFNSNNGIVRDRSGQPIGQVRGSTVYDRVDGGIKVGEVSGNNLIDAGAALLLIFK